MSIIVDCPSCTRKLRVPDDLLGQRVKCPTCGVTFDAAPAETPAPTASAPRHLDLSLDTTASPPLPDLGAPPRPEPPRDTEPPLERVPPTPPVPLPPPIDLQFKLKVLEDTGPTRAPSSDTPPEPRREPRTPPPSSRSRNGSRRDRQRCPACGERVGGDSLRCRYCGERLDDDDRDIPPWERRGRGETRRDCEPHRAGLILTLGIVSLVSVVLWFLCFIGLGLGIAAWVMGHRDLRKMREQQMDPQGKGNTQAGWICGIIGTILNGLWTLGCGAYILLIVFVMSSATTPPTQQRYGNDPPQQNQPFDDDGENFRR